MVSKLKRAGRRGEDLRDQDLSPRAEAGLLKCLLRMAVGEWLGGRVGVVERRLLTGLLIGVYAAEKEGRKVSKREACIELMGTDVMRTGPKYIKRAEQLGLIRIYGKPTEDKRKDFLCPTPELRRLLDGELELMRGAILSSGAVSSNERVKRQQSTSAVESPRGSEEQPEHAGREQREKPIWAKSRPTVVGFVDAVLARNASEDNPRLSEAKSRECILDGAAWTADQYVEYALYQYRAQRHDIALSVLSDMIARYPDDPMAYRLKAIFLEEHGQVKEAAAAWTKYIALEPTDPTGYGSRGLLYMALRQQDRAAEDFSKVIELEPETWGSTYGYRARAYIILGEFQKALADYNKAIGLSPESVEYYLGRAVAFAAVSDFDHALADAGKAIVLKPKSADGYCVRAHIYMDQNLVAEALFDLKIALRLAPDDKAVQQSWSRIWEAARPTVERELGPMPGGKPLPEIWESIVRAVNRVK